VALLTIMKTIAEDNRDRLSKNLSMHLVNLAFHEMTASKVCLRGSPRTTDNGRRLVSETHPSNR